MIDPRAVLAPVAAMALVIVGAAIQGAVGAGLSVVCGAYLMLWLGAPVAVPILLCLNLLVSVVASGCGGADLRGGDVVLASGSTLAGCVVASMLPSLPAPWLRALTAAVLLAVALPRPPPPGVPPPEHAARTGIAFASLVTGALTVWTATPGPVAVARAGRSGAEIRGRCSPSR